ncbi:hypothetical protein LPJ59_002879, partial [Coemansia sp. RSA 2399]
GHPNQYQHQQLQDNPQLANALAGAAQQQHGGFAQGIGAGNAAVGSVGPGQASADDPQKWLQLLRTFTRPFKLNDMQLDLNFFHAYKMFNQLKARGDTAGEASMSKFIQGLIEAIQNEVGKYIGADVLQLAIQESEVTVASAPVQVANLLAPTQLPPQTLGAQPTPAMSSAAIPDAALANRAGSNVQAALQGAFSGSTMNSFPTNPSAQPVSISNAASGAAPAAGKKLGTGKGSSSVAGTKSKKKSQSPRTSTKARKESPKASTTSQAQSALGSTVAANAATATTATSSTPVSQGAAAANNAPPMSRADSISAETATKIVSEIIATVDREEVKKFPRITLSEQDKRKMKEHLSFIEPLLDTVNKLLPVILMCLKSVDQIKYICNIEVIVREQLRLIIEDQYIVSPANTLQYYELLRKALGIAKSWGNMQQQQDHLQAQAGTRAPAAAGNQVLGAAAGENARASVVQETPLTNLHPGAMTNDPALENFQKAVKHPLDAVSLKLPAAKKRAANRASAANITQSLAASSLPSYMPGMSGQLTQQQRTQQQLQTLQHYAHPQIQTSAPFAPAPPVLPASTSKEDFDKLSLEMRTAIVKNQQAALIRQHSISINSASAAPSNISQANPLMLATTQGTAAPGVSTQSADEQRLKMLEQDKWNNPLEYLMCVLGKFSKGAERAGVEPSPILQQAFWPIARKSMMSNSWGVVAPDAVL